MKTVQVNDRSAILDVEEVSPHQGLILAETLCRLLVSTGNFAEGARMTGPSLVQFAEEMIEFNLANPDRQAKKG